MRCALLDQFARRAALCLLFLAGSLASSAAEDYRSAVEKRVQELDPSAEEKRFDQIGWAKNLSDARRLASVHQRPVFLFTHDGRINTGRC